MTGSIPSPLFYESSSYSIDTVVEIHHKKSRSSSDKKRIETQEKVRRFWQFSHIVIIYATFPVMFYYGDIFDDNPFGHKEFVNTEIHGGFGNLRTTVKLQLL